MATFPHYIDHKIKLVFKTDRDVESFRAACEGTICHIRQKMCESAENGSDPPAWDFPFDIVIETLDDANSIRERCVNLIQNIDQFIEEYHDKNLAGLRKIARDLNEMLDAGKVLIYDRCYFPHDGPTTWTAEKSFGTRFSVNKYGRLSHTYDTREEVVRVWLFENGTSKLIFPAKVKEETND